MIKVIFKSYASITVGARKRITDFLDSYAVKYETQVGYTQEDIDYIIGLVGVKRILKMGLHAPEDFVPTEKDNDKLRQCVIIDYAKKKVYTSMGTDTFSASLREIIPRSTREVQRKHLYEQLYLMENENYGLQDKTKERRGAYERKPLKK